MNVKHSCDHRGSHAILAARYVPGLSRALPETKERIGSLCAAADAEEAACPLGSPMFWGFARGGLNAPGVGADEGSSPCEAIDGLLLRQENPRPGEAIVVTVAMMLSQRSIASEERELAASEQRITIQATARATGRWGSRRDFPYECAKMAYAR